MSPLGAFAGAGLHVFLNIALVPNSPPGRLLGVDMGGEIDTENHCIFFVVS